jgi:hypothetical protein
MRHGSRFLAIQPALASAVLAAGCATFNPVPLQQVPFLDRAETRSTERVTVTAAVLSAEETRQVFSTDLYRKRIQPVWLEITNHTDELMLFLPSSLDPFYFSPLEAAQKAGWTWRKDAHREAADFFYDRQIELEIAPGETASGFVYANREKGVRLVMVEVVGEGWREDVELLFEVPGFKADFHQVEPTALYPDREFADLDEQELRAWIEELPCCVTNAAGTTNGDPLNLVVIGTEHEVWPAFFRAGWDPTETLRTTSALKTGIFGVFGGAYRYAPISSLYVYGRPQDIALQKVRSNIHYRNHLRLWLAPVTFQGKPVLVGQISRDIGSRLTTKSSTLTTHRIDPDVDETRGSLLQDFIYSQALAAFAFAGGVGAADRSEPRTNLTGDVYFTDGLRLVLMLTQEPTTILDIDYLHWADPAAARTGESPDR